jgi:hypothetical protein
LRGVTLRPVPFSSVGLRSDFHNFASLPQFLLKESLGEQWSAALGSGHAPGKSGLKFTSKNCLIGRLHYVKGLGLDIALQTIFGLFHEKILPSLNPKYQLNILQISTVLDAAI